MSFGSIHRYSSAPRFFWYNPGRTTLFPESGGAVIKFVSRITLWGVVLLALSGCFQTLNSPVEPSPTPQGGAVAVQPTAVPPTTAPVEQPTEFLPTIEGGQPTLEGPATLEQTAQFPPTAVETLAATAVTPFMTA